MADLVVVIHFAFVLFVVLGGLLLLRWPWLAYAHLPAAVWGVLVEYGGWICPLTPLEQSLRQRAGTPTYSGSFVEHYLLPVLYPTALTRDIQLVLGSILLTVNLAVYTYVLRRRSSAHLELS
jgi:hypothetical protein